MTTQFEIIVRYATATLFGLGGLAAVSPVLARPDVAELLAVCAKTSAVVATCCGAAVMVGYASHRIKLWAAQRPPELRPAMIEALTQTAGPSLAGAQEAVNVAYEAEQADAGEDEVERWKSAVVKFALLGNLRGFAWVDLRGLVDRPGWDCYTHLLADHDPAVLELGAGSRKTAWAPGWCYSRLRVDLKWDRLQLPYPASTPPVVRWARGYSVTPNMQAKHASTRAIQAIHKDS